MYSDFSFSKVYLMLGEACDFHCRHCLQHPSHNHFNKHPSEKLIKYLQHLARLRPRNSMRIQPTLDIIFFGGEPLLYWNAIKEVVSQLTEDNITLSIVSNGSMLDKDKVKYLNEHKIHFALSHDGKYTDKVRDYNILEDQDFVDLFKQVESKSISTTLHAYNQDLYSLWNYLNNKVPGINIGYNFLVLNWDMPEDIYSYDFSLWEKSMDMVIHNLFEAYKNTTEDISNLPEAQLISPYIKRRFAYYRGKAKIPACEAYRNIINLDLDGNHFLCHNGFCKFSECSQSGAKVAQEAQIHFGKLRVESKKPCQGCEAHDICWEGCPFTKWSKMQEKQCHFMKIFAKKIHEFMDMVDNLYTTEIEL